MDSHSAMARTRRHTAPAAPIRLFAETAVAVQSTLGVGDEEDNRALDHLERSVWLELARACPDRREREYLIEQARASVAPPGVPSCRHAIRLLVRAGGALWLLARELIEEDRERVERCAALRGEGAVRLERIALDAGAA
jgi:hypothetical protein